MSKCDAIVIGRTRRGSCKYSEHVANLGKTHLIQDAFGAARRPLIRSCVFDLAGGFLRRHTGETSANHAMHEASMRRGAGAGVRK